MNSKIDIALYLKQRLKTRFIGQELRYFGSTTSTQDIAKDLASNGSPEGTVVIAGFQKTGRGRLGRSWLSPQGGLAASIILKPSIASIRLLPAISSVAVFMTIKNIGIHANIKWPNDVLIKGKKVCGILIENEIVEHRLNYSIVGIGINVNFDIFKYPEIADIATSLSAELGKKIHIEEVALHLFTELENLYLRIGEPDFIIGKWVENMETMGKRISVSIGDNIFEGVATAINSEGNLVLRTDDGTEKAIIAGDVTVLKNKRKS